MADSAAADDPYCAPPDGAGGTGAAVDGADFRASTTSSPQGLPATGTRERLLTAGRAMGAPAPEVEGWVAAFDFLQTLRLTRQSDSSADPQQPNRIDLNTSTRWTSACFKACCAPSRRCSSGCNWTICADAASVHLPDLEHVGAARGAHRLARGDDVAVARLQPAARLELLLRLHGVAVSRSALPLVMRSACTLR